MIEEMKPITKDFENLDYVKIENYLNIPVVKVDDYNEFLDLVKRFNPELIYLCKGEYEVEDEKSNRYNRLNKTRTKILTEFLFYNSGIMYLLKAWNYKTIPDLMVGNSKGFKYGETYYKAREGGFSNFKEYQKCRSLGYKKKVDYLEAEKLGIRDCKKQLKKEEYKDYKIERLESSLKNELNRVKSESLIRYFGGLKSKSEGEIYYFAKECGYGNYKEFCDGISKGFKIADEYKDANSKGFIHVIQYHLAGTIK